MHALLAAFARLTSNHPRSVIAAVVGLTLVLGSFAGQQTTDTAMRSFAIDSDLAATLDRVQDEFSAGGSALQIVVDAGPGGDVLAAGGLRAALAAEGAVTSSPEAAEHDLVVHSFARIVLVHLGVDADGLGSANAAEIDAAAGRALDSGAAQLMSTDLDIGTGTARAGLVVVQLPPALSEDEAADVSVSLAGRIDALEDPGADLAPFNSAVMSGALSRASQGEMPRLLGLSMLLILGILMLQYRTVSDVLIALAGLVMAITWMMGIAVLLGPRYLGLVGTFSQMAMMVPVLLVGLGVDYAIHLTSRYREEQSHGLGPARSAHMAVLTVGGALVLATATTMVGFLTNLLSPLPPMADFGVFTAVGVLGAFVVMTTFVPAVRSLLDRRPGRSTVRVRRPASGLATAISRTATIAERAPRLALGAALVVSLAAIGAATQVGTTFSQDDFIPSDSDIGQTVDRIQTLFAGDLTETTFLVLDGDLADPAVANAQLALADRLAMVPGVRSAGGHAEVTSPAGLVAGLAALDPGFAGQATALGYSPGTGFAPDADVAGLYGLVRAADPAQAARTVAPDATAGVVAIATTAGQEGAAELARTIRAEAAPLEAAGMAVAITSEPLVLEESLSALTASQTRGIALTLLAALTLLMGYYGLKERTPVLGAITMVPSVAVVSWVLGTMWVLGISFNVMTAMVASLAIGIGVPFGIHVTHRFLEDRRRYDTVDEAIRQTVTHTGGAMAGSAATTAAGFGVLVLASLTPMRQFGTIVAITILYSFLAAVLVQPSCLKLWAQRRARRGDVAVLRTHELRDATAPERELEGV